MFKAFSVFAVSVTLVGGGFIYSHNIYNRDSANAFCHLDKSKMASIMDYIGSVVSAQEPSPEEDKYCERPSKDDPDKGGTDPKKIGCMCARKCENGKPSENYEDGKRCKVHCKPNNCSCPDPCAKT